MSDKNQKPLVEAYLFFNGSCEEAINFYGKALGAEIEMLMRFGDSPDPAPPEMVPAGFEKKIMHSSIRIGQTRIMASDGCEAGPATFQGFSLSFAVATQEAARQAFAALSEGGKVTMPLTPTFWSPLFGMVTDKFGVGWMVGVHPEETAA